MTAIRHRMRAHYTSYVDEYTRFVRMRGFESQLNDWPFVRRSFLECWAEPGFHRFWQVWNPGIAYFAYRLYLRLGGRKRWLLPAMGSFVGCGIAHTVAVLPFTGRWGWTAVAYFTCFGLFTALSRRLAPILRQDRWPSALNVAVNAGLLLLSFEVGFRVDRILR